MRPERWIYTVPLRLRSVFRRRSVDEELDEELRYHVERKTEENLARGMSAEEARRAALVELRGVERAKEECRETRHVSLAQDTMQDLRYAARMLRKSPGFTIVAVLTIALGIGATTAIFSVVDAALLRPLPYPQPGQLVSVVDDLPGAGALDVGLNRPEWQDLQHSGIFEDVSPTWYDENNLTGSSQPTTVRLLIEAPDYFALLGVRPKLGHAFDPDNDRPGFTNEVVISDGLWKRLFGRDPHILEKSIRLDTDLYRIIGVMPPGFEPPGRTTPERQIEVWAATTFYGPPLLMDPPRNRRNIPGAIARLKPGLTLAEAQSRVDALVASLEKQYPRDYPTQSAWRVRLLPLKQTVVGNLRESLLMLLGAVALVLLIGCVNVANLQLARGSARVREMAIRQALGAARKRLMRQLLTESILLSFIGGATGVAILFAMRKLLLDLVPETLPRLGEMSISWGVLLFALLVSLVAGVMFGLAPALHAGKLDLTHALKQEGRGSTGSGHQARTRRALVVTEFALSLVLMMAAGLLLRSFWGLLNERLGFNPENVLSIRTRLPYPNDVTIDKYATAAEEAPFLSEVLRRCRALPGVEEAAMGDSESIPLDQSQWDLNVVAEGQFLMIREGREVQGDQPVVERSSVTPEYFHLLRISLLRGRLFDELDNDKAPPVAVVNEAFSRTYFPAEDAIGKRFKQNKPGAPWITVVGVIANARTLSLARADIPQIYLDVYQFHAKHLALVLRGHTNVAAIPAEVREQVQAVDPTLPVFGAQTLNETRAASLAERRFSIKMTGLFALTALVLAGLGIYGVTSYVVSERRHEVGIRLALGAQRGNILRMVLRQGLGLASAGAGVGLLGALMLSRLMAGMLYGVRPHDPLTLGGVAVLLMGVALLGCVVPARRAMKVDPMVALRHD
jgi:predicted permease